MGERVGGGAVSHRIEGAKSILDDHASMCIAACDGGEPWAARVFFVDDEPSAGCFDLCCSLLVTSRKLAILRAAPRIAFVVGGDNPDRWIQGVGTAEVVSDEADGAAIRKRLGERTPLAAGFLGKIESVPIRIHVERLKVTDLSTRPPVAEFTFA